MILHTFENGDILQRRGDAIIAKLNGMRKVLSTAPHNGGYKSSLKYIFNHGLETSGEMKAPTYAEHIAAIASELSLDPFYTCGMSTAADVENLSLITESFEDLSVTAAVTGGIDINAGRAGDPAFWNESSGIFTYVAGTINILLFINKNLTDGALARSLVTCTEAKTAAIGELLLPSCYSSGLATGSGTDGTAIIADAESAITLTDAGKHTKLGEMIGKSVKSAVKEALYLQTGACPSRQFDVFRRIDRFGITAKNTKLKMDVQNKRELVVFTSLYVHLLDQLSWGLINEQDALSAAEKLLLLMGICPQRLSDSHAVGGAMQKMLEAYKAGIENDLDSSMPL
ncbi:adenosylcobinamide amidohydrolase [Hydrogenoanaerobacterium sp.]|uniref:adenosylcobinamide amidohydrolase n=1 Tax=Hydrogenoanaerobacterium sp. TaxID=2953763 RepID=UPI0028A245B4|nr:adenosylcobinamide amidohydrolase [Hydrogenoanaerobacterium sp.]